MLATTHKFRMHPRLLYDVVLRQAGTLSKAVLEGVMNAVDAGARQCNVILTADTLTIADNGQGFRNRREVKTWFEVFGQPHEADEQKRFGTFRMGRGQLFAYGVNVWRTRDFQMTVDFKEKGDTYDLTKVEERMKGCQITIQLYSPLLPSQLADCERDVKLWCRWMPIPVTFNGQLISRDVAEQEWSAETDEAYILLDESSELNVYNMGAFVRSLPKWQLGTGGEIVSKQKLEVNFARNDIQSTCPVWQKLKPLIDKRATCQNLNRRKMDDNVRRRLALQAVRDEINWSEFTDLPLFTAVTGRHYRVGELLRHAHVLSITKKGSVLGDTLHRQRAAFVLADETLKRFGMETLEQLVTWIQRKSSRNAYPFRVVPFSDLSRHLDQKLTLLAADNLRPLERVWLDLIDTAKSSAVLRGESPERWNRLQHCHNIRACDRKTMIGESNTAAAWTDGQSYVAISRGHLAEQPLALEGFIVVGTWMLHEYCHGEPDDQDHDHDQEFFERYHDSSPDFLATFVRACVSRLSSTLQRHNRKLTRRQLYQADKAVQGQRDQEKLLPVIARS